MIGAIIGKLMGALFGSGKGDTRKPHVPMVVNPDMSMAKITSPLFSRRAGVQRLRLVDCAVKRVDKVN